MLYLCDERTSRSMPRRSLRPHIKAMCNALAVAIRFFAIYISVSAVYLRNG